MKLINSEIRFEVTNACNARCVMCPREKMKRPQGVLDMGLYKRVLDEAYAAGADKVSINTSAVENPDLITGTNTAKTNGSS